MQVIPKWNPAGWFATGSAVRLMLSLGAAGLSGAGWSTPLAPERPRLLSQGQVAGQFLRAVLRASYPTAYSRLAPEVRQGISLHRFTTAAVPLWQSGQRHGTAIELYKLGVRLGNRGSSQLFYSFSFAADSSRKTPSELLEVTFRDTASRVVLGFALRHVLAPAPKSRVSPLKSKSRQKP